MAFYIRYYENEVLLQKSEEILPYLQSINKLTPEELDIIDKRIGKLRSGTNRIYLDAAKKRYLLAIGTTQTSIEEFQKNSKMARQQNTAEQAAEPAAETPAAEPVQGEWKIYYLDFALIENEQPVPYTFKAKIRNASLESAYNQMKAYLMEKHGDTCLVPELSEDAIWCENE